MKPLSFAVCLIATATLSGQTPSCAPSFDRLRYPAAALAARIQGTVAMSFVVGADGKATDVDSNAYPLLKVEVEEALKSETMAQECSGKRVSIRVNFLLDGSSNSFKRTDTIFEVVAPAPTIEVTISDPAWIFTRKGRFFHRVRGWFSKPKA